MFRKLNSNTRTRISPASPIALLALFVALGGGAYAASGTVGTVDLQNRAVTKAKLDRNSVVPGKIKGGAVTRQKLRNGLVNTAKLAPDAVTGPKVNEATLDQVPSAAKADEATEAEHAEKADTATSAQTAASVGPDGVDTAAIQGGAVTAPKLGTVAQRSTSISVPAGDTRFEGISCLAGEQLLGGGAVWTAGLQRRDGRGPAPRLLDPLRQQLVSPRLQRHGGSAHDHRAGPLPHRLTRTQSRPSGSAPDGRLLPRIVLLQGGQASRLAHRAPVAQWSTVP